MNVESGAAVVTTSNRSMPANRYGRKTMASARLKVVLFAASASASVTTTTDASAGRCQIARHAYFTSRAPIQRLPPGSSEAIAIQRVGGLRRSRRATPYRAAMPTLCLKCQRFARRRTDAPHLPRVFLAQIAQDRIAMLAIANDDRQQSVQRIS